MEVKNQLQAKNLLKERAEKFTMSFYLEFFNCQGGVLEQFKNEFLNLLEKAYKTKHYKNNVRRYGKTEYASFYIKKDGENILFTEKYSNDYFFILLNKMKALI